MADRKGEKLGWTGGWLGGFIWVAILSIVFIVQGKTMEGVCGLAIVVAAVAVVLYFAPWKNPSTPAWKLMVWPYLMFIASIVWAVHAFGGLRAIGLSWWNAFALLPMLLPLWTGGGRKWTDGESK